MTEQDWYCKREDILRAFPGVKQFYRYAKTKALQRPGALFRPYCLDQDQAKAVLAEMFRLAGAQALRRAQGAHRRLQGTR